MNGAFKWGFDSGCAWRFLALCAGVGSPQVTFKKGKLVRRKSLLYMIIPVYCHLAFTDDLKPTPKL